MKRPSGIRVVARVLCSCATWGAVQGVPVQAATVQLERIESRQSHDADGARDFETSVSVERSDPGQGAWRWRAAWLQARRVDGGAQAATFGALRSWTQQEGPGRTGALPWLRELGLALHANGEAPEWRLAAGHGPLQLVSSRDNIAWWLGLHAQQWQLQFEPDWQGVQWQLAWTRLDISDGNRVNEATLRAEPRWAATRDGSVQAFAVAHRRSARLSSPYYWSPTNAESQAGLGLRLSLRQGAWKLVAEAQALEPLNRATTAGSSGEVRLSWRVARQWRIGVSAERNRARAVADPYWSNGSAVFVECRCFDGGAMGEE